MPEGTRLQVLTGVHGLKNGEIGSRDVELFKDCENQIAIIKDRKEDEIKKGDICFKVEDVGESNEGVRELDENKFIAAVKKFAPTVLVLAWCWSQQSELNDLLRAAGIYSALVLREELCQITKSRHVLLDEGQERLIRRIAETEPDGEPSWGLFLFGPSGTGKTILLAEGLEMRISQLRRAGKHEVKVIVTTMATTGFDQQLLEDFKKKYLPGLATFMKLSQLAEELNVKWDPNNPQLMIEKILSSLSAQRSQSSSHTILLVDEVRPMSREEEEGGDKADWSSLTSREGVDFLLALSTKANNRHFFTVVPPEDSRVLWQRLTTAHRNCIEIGAFLQFFVQHCDGLSYISSTEEDQQAEHLPPGRLPVWVEKSIEVTDDEVFKFVKENYLADASMSVTVLGHNGDPTDTAENRYGWRHLDDHVMNGSEDEGIILLDARLTTETISRARNLLVIVTTRGRCRCKTLLALLILLWQSFVNIWIIPPNPLNQFAMQGEGYLP